MLIDGDDIINDIITLSPCFLMFDNSRLFPLPADSRKSDSSVRRGATGNWRWNSNSSDGVASSPFFSRPFPPPRRRSAPEILLAGEHG